MKFFWNLNITDMFLKQGSITLTAQSDESDYEESATTNLPWSEINILIETF